ncbi:hypothetical protein BDZ94DRAFT_1312308 [Collybia nuda]|uniref:F-box domain-containing protein n=1 Tax=Collybia nuda TaxID=64659 RepID=A0A9P5XZ96_9AGAR|nr:hypothetical protein BDZ94DRAFT_1312308 [Collybia nuda]
MSEQEPRRNHTRKQSSFIDRVQKLKGGLDLLDRGRCVNAAVLKQQAIDIPALEAGLPPPIQRIPPEILSAIFIECLVETRVELPPRRRGPGHESYPWVLGHVCSHWSTVLWSTPEIWESIHISACKVEKIPLIPSMMQYITGRTKTAISLNNLDFPQESIIDVIIPNPERFKDVKLFLTPSSFSAFFQLPFGRFDALEFIAIRCAGFPSSFPSQNTSPLMCAPKLKRVIVQLFRTERCPPPLLLLPWAQLTHLTLIGVEVFPDFVHRTILRQSTSIVDCKMRLAHGKFTPLTEEVVLPYLRKLQLASHHSLDWDTFLDPFVFPSLKTLAVVQPAIQTYTSLITRSNCALQGLTVDAPGANYRELQPLFWASPSLVELQANCILPPSFFEDISERGLFPYLHRLITVVDPEGLHAFLDLFEHNQEKPYGKVKIAHAYIECRQGPGTPDVAQRFRRLSSEWAHDAAWKNILVRGLGVAPVSE